MLRKVGSNTNPRVLTRVKRKTRIGRKIALHRGSVARLVIYRSNTSLYAQVIDDLKAHTVIQASTREEEFGKMKSRKNLAAAKALGLLLGKRALEKNVSKVLFDRNGFDYHGKIKAIADGAREAGLQF